jgi:D-erythrulose 1-phosphate 3-epimerase
VGLEQMYSPHQIPWTIQGAKEIMARVSEKSTKPLYITIDTGHQSGQKNFLKPDHTTLLLAMEEYRQGGQINPPWLGPDSAYTLFETGRNLEKSRIEDLIEKIRDEMECHSWLFAENIDCSAYNWLEELACYSPIIHLQQTDGKSSRHWPFTRSNNEKGIIEGRKVLEAIKTSYENQALMVPKIDKIYLTIEVFVSTESINYFTVRELRETIRYWRQFIPEDGKKLNELI